MCENHKNPVAQTKEQEAEEIGKYEPESALVACVEMLSINVCVCMCLEVKVFPPVELKVDGFNVSWSHGSPLNTYLKDHDFELQYRSDEQNWMVSCFSLCSHFTSFHRKV